MIHFPANVQNILYYAGYAALGFVVVSGLVLIFLKLRNRRT
jgi:hypothetical protein